MTNVYNILYTRPALEPEHMFTSLEALAQELVESGLIRIDADERSNFVRYPIDGDALFFSHRELHDVKLLHRAKRQVSDEQIDTLKKTFKTVTPISNEVEAKIARLIVQAAHPAIIKLAILEEVEFFASFEYNVSDLMAMHEYENFYGTGGLQAFHPERTRIYVSCAGNPFSNVPEQRQAAFASMARFIIIGAQEIGHYADLARNKSGQVIGRFSAQKFCLESRHKDMAWLEEVAQKFRSINLSKAAKIEQSVSFYAKHRKGSIKHRWMIMMSWVFNKIINYRAVKLGIPIAPLHSARWLSVMLADMKFNLDPKGYENSNKRIEELTKSAEALARVPQQEQKWGRKTVEFLYPNLHEIYYSTIIPSVIETLEKKSGKDFKMKYKKPSRWQRFLIRRNSKK